MRWRTALCRPGHADALAGVLKDLDDRGRSDLKELESTLVELGEVVVGRGLLS